MIENRLAVEIAVAALLAAGCEILRRGWPAMVDRAVCFTSRTRTCIVLVMLLPVVARLALLPWIPAPAPLVADEFSHLLVADTLASGRLANEPHPLAMHLETPYVLQEPTYSSIYPIGQGAILAVGQILTGHPWAGVLLAVALMAGAITWMLYGCVPARWAVAGGVLAAWQFGFSSYWATSYWGGAFCAFGGALLLGALCRLHRAPSLALACAAGVGWGIVWFVRPFESVALLGVAWVAIGAFLVRDRIRWTRWFWPVVLFVSVQALIGGVTLLHNHAVSGSWTTFPYELSRRIYGVPQGFVWDEPAAMPPSRFREMESIYAWQREHYDRMVAEPSDHLRGVITSTWRFFVTPWHTLPLLLLVPAIGRDPWVAAGAALMIVALTASLAYPFFNVHYIAAYTGVVVFLIVRGLMLLSKGKIHGVALGRSVAVFLILVSLVSGLRSVPATVLLGVASAPVSEREQLIDRLDQIGGRHAVVVRYGPDHRFHDEWVYNGANIDASSIVWVRWLGTVADARVAHYYPERLMWLADVSDRTVHLRPYRPLASHSPDPNSYR
jgi:hypothetical protein